MNRFYHYLAASVVAASAFTASAQPEGLRYGYCSDNIVNVGIDNAGGEYWMAAAFQMTESDTRQFDGCDVTGVSIGFGSGRNKEVTIFLTYDLAEAPFFEQKGRVRVGQWCDIDLTGAPKVESGKPFYVGYRYHVENASAKPVGCDDNMTGYTSTADWISVASTLEGLSGQWKHYGKDFGNVNLRVFLKGESLVGNNCIPDNVQLPDFAHPGEEFSFKVAFINASQDPVESVQVKYQIGDDEPEVQDFTLTTAVKANERGSVKITATTDQDNFRLPVKAWITKVNGEDNASAERAASGAFACTNGLFMRKIVAEKLTGQSCGYCPRAIVAYDTLRAKVGDRFIGIEVHNYTGREPFYATDYTAMLSHYRTSYGGAPSLTVNRDEEHPVGAEKSSLYEAFRSLFTEACQYGIKASFKESSKANCLDVTATVISAYDEDNANLAVTFAITEDDLFGQQANNYNQGTGCPEFVGKGSWVNMYYHGVARSLHSDWDGIPGSVPASLEAGKEYSYTAEGLSMGNTKDKMKANVVALLINKADGTIVNADMVHVDPDRGYNYPVWKNVPLAVESVDVDVLPYVINVENGAISLRGEGEARIYSVAGMEMGIVSEGRSLSVTPGIYFVCGGGKTQKLCVGR